MLGEVADADDLDARHRHFVIVFHRSATDADSTYQIPHFIDDGQAAREGDEPVIGVLNAV